MATKNRNQKLVFVYTIKKRNSSGQIGFLPNEMLRL